MRRIISFVSLIAMVCVSVGVFGLVNLKPANAATDTKTQTIILTVTSTITLTLTTTTIDLGTLVPGTPITGDTSLAVTTNEYNGWNLQVKRDDGASTLNLNGVGAPNVTFPDASDWTYLTPNATTSPEVGANLSFRVLQTGTDAALYDTSWWGTDDTALNALYAGFPSGNQQIATVGSYVAAAQNVAYQIRADAPGTQQSGVYTGTVTFTALTNP